LIPRVGRIDSAEQQSAGFERGTVESDGHHAEDEGGDEVAEPEAARLGEAELFSEDRKRDRSEDAENGRNTDLGPS
jgi:hypothetical protein